MVEQLKTFIENLKMNPRVSSFNEDETKMAIILRLLQLLGWDFYNVDEVTPEFSVENRKVDYALRVKNSSEVFLEVKKTAEDLEKHQEQLLDYSFRQGVELAILTNGMTWWFYLPTKKGDWKSRKFYTIDLGEQESSDVAQKFTDLLSKPNVQTGEALHYAESIYKGKLKKKILEETLPKAWNKLISEPDPLLLDLLSDSTEKICGFKADAEDLMRFLKSYDGQFLLLPIDEFPGTENQTPVRSKPKTSAHPTRNEMKISQDDLIPHIIKVLHKHGGSARKEEVEKEIYQIFERIFRQPYYQEKVSNGRVPRWQHDLAWAKDRARQLHGYIKSAEESGRGYWELTYGGERYYQAIKHEDENK